MKLIILSSIVLVLILFALLIESNDGHKRMRRMSEDKKKSSDECFEAFKKDINYFYQVLADKSLSLNETQFGDEQYYLNTTLNHFDDLMSQMDKLETKCLHLTYYHNYCLRECQRISSQFEKTSVTVFQLLLVVDRYDQQFGDNRKDMPIPDMPTPI